MHPRFSATDIFYIALGGMLGSLLRWWVGLGFEGLFPVPTILVNILGTATLGILYASQHRLHLQGRYLYMVGFCGSFTTVSLFSYETIELMMQGDWLPAFLNLGLPVIASLVVVALIIRPVEKAVERKEQ